jgi:hypothetical protein
MLSMRQLCLDVKKKTERSGVRAGWHMTRGVARHDGHLAVRARHRLASIDPGCERRIANMAERMAGERGTRHDREECPSVTVTPIPEVVQTQSCIVASAADLLVALGEMAANQRHVECERLPGRGDRTVVAIYAQLVVVVWRVRGDGHDLHEVERGRGQH